MVALFRCEPLQRQRSRTSVDHIDAAIEGLRADIDALERARDVLARLGHGGSARDALTQVRDA